MKKPTVWNPSPPDPDIFANAFAQLWRARITENDLWCPEPQFRQIQKWLKEPTYDLDPIKCVFSPRAIPEASTIAWPTMGTGIANAPEQDVQTRILAEHKQQVVKIVEGCTIKLEWYEFVDREAKSVYWSEVLRRKAWQEPQKEK